MGSLSFPERFDMEFESLPPILTTRGLHLVAWGSNDGKPWFKLAAGGRSRVREVVIYVTSDQPVNVRFEYAIYDSTLHAVKAYSGRYGDPERDTFTGLLGLQSPSD